MCSLNINAHWQMQTTAKCKLLLGSCLCCVIFFKIHKHTYFEYLEACLLKIHSLPPKELQVWQIFLCICMARVLEYKNEDLTTLTVNERWCHLGLQHGLRLSSSEKRGTFCSVFTLSMCSPSISPSLPFIQQISTDHHWEVGFPGGAGGKEPTCQCRRHKRLWVWSLGWEDPLEEGMATHSSILAWRIPWTVRCGGLPSMGSHRVRHDWIPWCLWQLALGPDWEHSETRCITLGIFHSLI